MLVRFRTEKSISLFHMDICDITYVPDLSLIIFSENCGLISPSLIISILYCCIHGELGVVDSSARSDQLYVLALITKLIGQQQKV